MNDTKKISVVINTYNAERHLLQVINAAKGFDEIVVCDMESTDNTLAIAKSMGCRVVTFEKKDYNSNEKLKEILNILSKENIGFVEVRKDEI